jgi:hypothetical protein
MMVPQPPRELIPNFHNQPTVQLSDIRRERMSERDIRDYLLSDYTVVRFEKPMEDYGVDSEGRRFKADWKTVVRTTVRITNTEAVQQIRRLDQKTKPVGEKKKTLNPDQQRQLEKVLEELNAMERDPNYHVELCQIDHQLKEIDYYPHRRNHHRRKSEGLYRRSDSLYGRTRSRSRSRGAKHHKKTYQRISLTGYYKRCPKPQANAQLLLRWKEQNMNTPTPQQQMWLQQQHQQQMMMQQGMHPAGPPGVRPPGLTPGGKGPIGIVKLPNGGKPKPYHDSDSDSDSYSSNSSRGWSESHDSRSSMTDSTGYRRSKRGSKDRRHSHKPAHYGATRRHSRLDHDFVPPLVPAPPRPQPQLLPNFQMEAERANAFEAGRLEGRAEGRAEGRVQERIEARIEANEEAAIHAAYRPRLAPTPRVIQDRRRSIPVRHVHPDDVSYDESDIIIDRLDGLSLERRSDPYGEDLEDALYRRRDYEQRLRGDDPYYREERMMSEDRGRPRERGSPVQWSNSNPFMGGPRLSRRNTVSYTRGTYYP